MPSTNPQSPDRPIDVREMNEAFEDVDGQFKFTGTLVVYQNNDNLYHAVSKTRYSTRSDVRLEHLINKVPIPVTAYMPLFSSGFTRAPDPLPHDSYAKRPRLSSYDRLHQGQQPNEIADSLLAEVAVCELLKRNPHPNVAKYLGCQVSDGRISGICLAKYGRTLKQMVNPCSYMKRRLGSTGPHLTNKSQILEGVESGIRHLHSLRLIHNDINPSNIMLDGDIPIIIDFGSCRREGEGLEGVGRTYEWHDETVQTALPKNDLDALEEIRIWMSDGDSKVFQFAE